MGLLLKIVIFLTVAFLGIAWWRNLVMGKRPRPPAPRPATKLQPTQPIASCRYCGVFVPEEVVVKGLLGAYCCQVHKNLCEPESTSRPQP